MTGTSATLVVQTTERPVVFVKRGTRLTIIGCRSCGARAVLGKVSAPTVARFVRKIRTAHRCGA